MASVSDLAATVLPKATLCQRILAGFAVVLLSAALVVALLITPFEAYMAIAAIIIGLTYYGLALDDDARAPAIMAAAIVGAVGAFITFLVIVEAKYSTVTTFYVAIVIFVALGASRSVPAGKEPPAEVAFDGGFTQLGASLTSSAQQRVVEAAKKTAEDVQAGASQLARGVTGDNVQVSTSRMRRMIESCKSRVSSALHLPALQQRYDDLKEAVGKLKSRGTDAVKTTRTAVVDAVKRRLEAATGFFAQLTQLLMTLASIGSLLVSTVSAATLVAAAIVWTCGFVPIFDTFFLKLKEALDFKVISPVPSPVPLEQATPRVALPFGSQLLGHQARTFHCACATAASASALP